MVHFQLRCVGSKRIHRNMRFLEKNLKNSTKNVKKIQIFDLGAKNTYFSGKMHKNSGWNKLHAIYANSGRGALGQTEVIFSLFFCISDFQALVKLADLKLANFFFVSDHKINMFPTKKNFLVIAQKMREVRWVLGGGEGCFPPYQS